MCKKILSASVALPEETIQIIPSPGVNILRGGNAEAVLLTLADIFSGKPTLNAKAKIQWHENAVLFVSATEGVCFVDKVQYCADAAQLVKDFHKQRFLTFRNRAHILDGAKLSDTLDSEDDRPLFVHNFWEQLDAPDREAALDTITASGRQCFIAIP